MITEFPKKWVINKCSDIDEYLTENSVRKEETIYKKEEVDDDKFYVHFPAFKENKGKNEEGEERGERLYHISDKIEAGYELINIEEFYVCLLNSPSNNEVAKAKK